MPLMALPFALRNSGAPLRDMVQVTQAGANVGLRGWPLWRWLIIANG